MGRLVPIHWKGFIMVRTFGFCSGSHGRVLSRSVKLVRCLKFYWGPSGCGEQI